MPSLLVNATSGSSVIRKFFPHLWKSHNDNPTAKSGRAQTSADFRYQLQMKQQAKLQERLEKEERAKQREQKRRDKEASKTLQKFTFDEITVRGIRSSTDRSICSVA